MKKALRIFWIIAFVAIITMVIGTLTGCDKDEPDPVLCSCNPKDHLGIGETCNCTATVKPCDCTLHEYGKLGNVIPIYRSGNVTEEQMTATVALIWQSYNEDLVFNNLDDDFQNIVKNIYITSGETIERKGDIVEVGCNATREDIGTQFAFIALGLD